MNIKIISKCISIGFIIWRHHHAVFWCATDHHRVISSQRITKRASTRSGTSRRSPTTPCLSRGTSTRRPRYTVCRKLPMILHSADLFLIIFHQVSCTLSTSSNFGYPSCLSTMWADLGLVGGAKIVPTIDWSNTILIKMSWLTSLLYQHKTLQCLVQQQYYFVK